MARGQQGSGVEPLKESIRVRFTWQGKRHYETLKLAPTAPNLKATERMMADIRRKIAAGVFDPQEFFPKAEVTAAKAVPLFREIAKQWLATWSGAKSSKKSNAAAIRFWDRALGDLPIDGIKQSKIKEAIADKAATTSGKTLNNYMIALRGVFGFAEADDLITPERNPTKGVKHMPHQKPLPQPLEMEEVLLVLDYMRDHYPEQVLNYFEFAICTGMRTSELIALTWGKVDWRKERVLVDTARVLYEDKGTKTNTARDVDLTARAIAVLKRQKVHTFMKGPDAAIFENPVNSRAWIDEQDQSAVYWNPCLRALGMRARTAYQTRHTFATLGLMGGVNPAYLARQLGHTNTAMLFKHYARWIDGADSGREAAKMNALFGHELATEKVQALKTLD